MTDAAKHQPSPAARSDSGQDDNLSPRSSSIFDDIAGTMVQFGLKLRRNVYQPWQDKYMDYDKLKKLLREKDESAEWTDRDEETSAIARVGLL